MEEIPFTLRLFSLLYETRIIISLPLLAGGLILLGYAVRKGRRDIFLAACLFPFLFLLLNLAFTWCGWHYRMELRDRWAVEQNTGLVNINRMPPAIYLEYAKHDFHPRFQDLKAQSAGILLLTPFILTGEFVLWLFLFRKRNVLQ